MEGEELLIEDSSDEEDGPALEENEHDDEDDDEVALEDNDEYETADEEEDELALEDNEEEDGGLALEDNEENDDDGLALEDNEEAESPLLTESSGGGSEGPGASPPGRGISDDAGSAVGAGGVSSEPPMPQLPAAPLVGKWVIIGGLASRPELNGKSGRAVSFSSEKGRYGVKVEGESGLLALRPDNLRAAPGALKARVERETAKAAEGAEAAEAEEAEGAEGVRGTELAEAAAVGSLSKQHEEALALAGTRPSDCADLLLRLLPLARSSLGNEHNETLAIMNNLNAILQQLGRHDQAAPLAREVVTRRRAAFGDRDPTTLNAMTNLGSLLAAQGDLEQAVEVRTQVLELRREALGKKDPSTLVALDNLASAKLALAVRDEKPGDFLEAGPLALLEEAVALLVEEFAYLLSAHGKGCKDKMRPETQQTASKIYEVVMRQPELGVEVKGYNELTACLQAIFN